ncbi:MAG: hypothetical protein CUN53_03650 [Phototrophicales bacterium]|nr:MAG: hypothetical protein CUN53_03650 [Phototrophicales bacterium]
MDSTANLILDVIIVNDARKGTEAVFTINIEDEEVYRMLVERAAQQGDSIDDVLRALLASQPYSPPTEPGITPAQKLMALIDASDLRFDNPFDARDAL